MDQMWGVRDREEPKVIPHLSVGHGSPGLLLAKMGTLDEGLAHGAGNQEVGLQVLRLRCQLGLHEVRRGGPPRWGLEARLGWR